MLFGVEGMSADTGSVAFCGMLILREPLGMWLARTDEILLNVEMRRLGCFNPLTVSFVTILGRYK